MRKFEFILTFISFNSGRGSVLKTTFQKEMRGKDSYQNES